MGHTVTLQACQACRKLQQRERDKKRDLRRQRSKVSLIFFGTAHRHTEETEIKYQFQYCVAIVCELHLVPKEVNAPLKNNQTNKPPKTNKKLISNTLGKKFTDYCVQEMYVTHNLGVRLLERLGKELVWSDEKTQGAPPRTPQSSPESDHTGLIEAIKQ